MIGELGPEDIEQLLRAEVLGRIGCHARGRTYVVPVTYAYDGASIFGYTGNGLKVRMMRENPAVCVEVEQLDRLPSWRTAIAFGRFEELTGDEAAAALRLLRERLRDHGGRPLRAIGTWAPGPEATAPRQPILYAVRISEKTGRYELAP